MPSPSFLIRLAQPNDFAQFEQIKPLLTKEVFQARLDKQRKNEAEFLVIEDNAELTCFAFLKWDGKPTHPEYPDIEDLYTKKECRGRGYAKILIQECENRAKARGFTKIGLAANIDPTCPARILYEKLGYRSDGREKYVDGMYNGAQDWAIDLEKSLLISGTSNS